MTLFELLWLLVILAFGAAGSIWGGSCYEPAGFGLGLIAGMLAPCVLAWCAMAVDTLLFNGIPWLPRCVCGAPATRFRICSEPVWCHRCDCGERYVKQRNRVFRLGARDESIPYMRWRPFGPWIPAGPHRSNPYRG